MRGLVLAMPSYEYLFFIYNNDTHKFSQYINYTTNTTGHSHFRSGT